MVFDVVCAGMICGSINSVGQVVALWYCILLLFVLVDFMSWLLLVGLVMFCVWLLDLV